MTIYTTSSADWEASLQLGIDLKFGPFIIRLNSNVKPFADLAAALYQPYLSPQKTDFADFHVSMDLPLGLRRWLRPQVLFGLDGRRPFAPYSHEHALPAFEWGVNWCIATRAHHLLMLHCAVVERNGFALMLPAWPGHGKSTLCSALIHNGWRLLSDEFGLVRPEDGCLLPIPRLIPLKNQSIEVIADFCPSARLGPKFYETRKGTVAHVIPPADSIQRSDETAKPRWLVFPRWIAGASLSLEPLPKTEAFFMVATNAFNYEVLDQVSFNLVSAMVDQSDSYTLCYSKLDEAIAALNELSANV